MAFEPVFRDVGFYVNRDGHEDSKKLGMLKTITYPTGGETEFVYEGNKYDYAPYYTPGQNTALLEGPGLRIKEVISKPVNGGKNIHKIFKYGAYEDGRGFLGQYSRPETTHFKDLLATESNVMHFGTFDYTLNGQGQAGYRTRDYFSDPYVKFDFSGNLIKYDAVTEFYMEDGVPKQKTKSSYGWDYNGFDYYPGKGGSNNVFELKTTSNGVSLNFEQHASVSKIEQIGLNILGFKIGVRINSDFFTFKLYTD